MKYWIKERNNPQLETYYIACGRMTKRDAKKLENAKYGYNTMHSYETKEDYQMKIASLKSFGFSVEERI